MYVHFVWTTWDREPLITPLVEPRIYSAIAAKCHELGCQPIEIGGVEDHVHVLVRLSATVSIAQLAHGIKGSSSHLATHALNVPFKWRGSYGAFSVGRSEVTRIRKYIRNQKEHHAKRELVAEWERDEEPRPGK